MQYEIGRSVCVSVLGDDRVQAAIATALDPYGPAPDEQTPDVVIEPLHESTAELELLNPAGDGLVTAWDGSSLYLRIASRWCRTSPPALRGPFVFAYETGFPLARVFNVLIRPALQIAASGRGVCAVHGAAVVRDGAGIVVAGWSESGKTETALAFMEEGAAFLSDKWTLVGDDATIRCFPISVGIRRWMLSYAPTLKTSLPQTARLQLGVAGAAAALNRVPGREQLRNGRIGGLISDSLDRMIVLAERAAISPTRLSAAYGSRPPTEPASLGAVLLLTTIESGRPQARPADPSWAARRLARSATYERRRYFDLNRRVRYVGGEGDDLANAVEMREEGQLTPVLERVAVIEVRAPFPCDPRRIVDAVRPLL